MKTLLLSALAATTLFTAGCRTVAVAVHDEPVRTARVSHYHGRSYYDGGSRWDRRSDRYYSRGYSRPYRSSRTIIY